MRIIIVTLLEPLNCWGLLISMFTQTKGLLFLLTFFFENRVKTKYIQILKCSCNFWAIFIFGPLTIVLQKSIKLMTRIDQFALKIQKAKKYPWGETWLQKIHWIKNKPPLILFSITTLKVPLMSADIIPIYQETLNSFCLPKSQIVHLNPQI